MSTQISTTTADQNEISLSELLNSRVATYRLLSQLYQIEVSKPLYEELRTMKFPTNTGSADADSGYLKICNYLSAAKPNALTELAVDYVRTFIGHGNDGYSAAYPFESVYTSPKRLLMQGARDEILVLYRAAGVEKRDSWKDGEDHIALELEFMQILGNRTIAALEIDEDDDVAVSLLKQQKNFLENHLLAWVPMMVADIERFSKTDFYKGLSELTIGFLNVDFEFLLDLLADIEGSTKESLLDGE